MELNNEAVSAAGGIDGNVSYAVDAKTLEEPGNGQVQIRAQESVVDQISVYPDSCVADASAKNGSSVVSEERVEADLETDTISIDGKIAVHSESLEDADTGEQRETLAGSKPKLVAGDKSEPETNSSSSVLFNGVKNASDSSPCKVSSISGQGNDDGSGNQAMEIDAKVENQKNLADLELAKPVDSSLSKDRIEPDDVDSSLSKDQIESDDVDSSLSKDQIESDDVDSPAASRAPFKVSDLVWGKVRSYPWWPGQILDPSVASDKVKKYFKRGSYLIAYFGDQTFAWNDVSRIKPFRENFSQMENQSRSADFRDAVDCALEEISERVEYSLTCPCVPNEVYDKSKTQTIVDGQEEPCEIEVGDSVSGATSFEPLNLVEYVRSLACTASNNVPERLKFVTLRAQLLSFHRWKKGYPELPEFQLLQGSLETAKEQAKNLNETPDSAVEPKACELVSNAKIETVDRNAFRHNHSSEDEEEQTLADFIADLRRCKRNRDESKDKSRAKSVFERKKRKVKDSQPVRLSRKARKPKNQIFDYSVKHDRDSSSVSTCNVAKTVAKPVFGVGASILKVANRLNGSDPIILKPYKGSSKNKQ